MTLAQILIFVAAALLYGIFTRGRWRGWVLLIASLIAVYWLQPPTPIRHLDFWMATVTVGLTIWSWSTLQTGGPEQARQNWITGGVIVGLVLVIGLTRYLDPFCCLTPTRPPDTLLVLISLGIIISGAVFLIWQKGRNLIGLYGMMVLLLAVFLVLKTTSLSLLASNWLRGLTGQNTALASALDLRWLGFSYIAFRLIHTLRDRQTGKPVDLSLQEYITYVVFFPALSAGPIDRSQRFAQDLRKPFIFSPENVTAGGERLLRGVFKKFVLADTLALAALSEANAAQIIPSPWSWVMLYAYSLRIFFDFSGYTDIAIGLGLLVGIRLPENFDQPYLKANLTAFWNSWHMTLAQWFRAYFFNPLTRALRTSKRPIPMPIVILLGQFGTMILIGLWHGITLNFLIWGAWHGLGLFIHNRWSEMFRLLQTPGKVATRWNRWSEVAGILLTFHYVTLGWVWFVLPLPQQSWQYLLNLFKFS